MDRHRRIGLLSLGLGLALSLFARGATPTMTPPLYDGVIVVEPYRYLVPPPGGRGGPLSASATEALDHGASPLTAIATGEQPPQAQIFATPGALTLPAGTSSIRLSIAPIPAEGQPADGHIVGNVYRILVTNQNGVRITAPAAQKVTVVLRGPGSLATATIERFTPAGGWQAIETQDAGFGSTFLAVVTEFGDFALVVAGPGPTAVISAPPSVSAAPQASTAVASAGPTVPGVAASASPTGSGGPTGGLPIGPIGGAVVVVLAAAGLVALRARHPRHPTRYRGARPRGERKGR